MMFSLIKEDIITTYNLFKLEALFYSISSLFYHFCSNQTEQQSEIKKKKS